MRAKDEIMNNKPRRSALAAHSRSASRANMSDSLPDLASTRARPYAISDCPPDGTPSKHSKYSPPSSPRAHDPFLSISRAIHNVKIRTGARLSALAVKQRYARSTARHRSVYVTAKAVTRTFFLITLVLFTATLLFDRRNHADKPHALTGFRAFLKRRADDFSGQRAREIADALEQILRHRPPARTTRHLETGPWAIAVIADLDKESCRFQENRDAPMKHTSCGKANTWVSYFKRGIFTLDPASTKMRRAEAEAASVEWLDEIELNGHSHFEIEREGGRRYGGRGMELSELEWFNGHLLTPDDRTGMLLEVMAPRGRLGSKAQEEFYGDASKVSPSIFQRATLLDGPGNDASAFFKSEWMVVKDDKLIVGGHGRSFTDPEDGTRIKNDNPKWVKVIGKDFKVAHVNWSERYDLIAKAAGVVFPGYLMHEAVLWSAAQKEWIFLPRRVSKEPFDAEKNERRGSNVAIIVTEDFKTITRVEIKGLGDPTGWRGFSSAKFVPGTGDSVILALRTIEIESSTSPEPGRETATFLSAFELPSGKLILREQSFTAKKFEGLVFL